jgi:vacuolar iron transporter family protein
MIMIKVSRFSIGSTAAITTSMGLIAGLAHGDAPKASIIAGLLIIAVADNISDTLGIHIYKESEGASKRDTLLFTYGNFFARLLIVLTFVLIVFILPTFAAVITASVWGLVLLAILSYLIAKNKNTNHWREIIWHLSIATAVIFGSKLLGNLILK